MSLSYDYIKKNPTVFLDQSISLNSSIKKANVVVVNNSTVGLEAIVKGKSVLALGNSYYDSSEICLKLDNRKDLQHYLKKSLSYTPSQGKVYDFLFQLINQELVEGFITDKNLIAAKQITQKILNSKS